MHKATLAADVGFVGFNLAAHLPAVLGLQRETQARQHEPRGRLGNAEGAPEFVWSKILQFEDPEFLCLLGAAGEDAPPDGLVLFGTVLGARLEGRYAEALSKTEPETPASPAKAKGATA